MKKKINLEIVEMFTAKAGIGMKGFDRCFHGTIRRKDENNNPVVFGKIIVKNKILDGHIIAMADNQWILGEKLDELVVMILDKGLHNDSGVFVKRYDFEYHLN